MAERPILFSGPMVRAILDGRKTQTRRLVKPNLRGWGLGWYDKGGVIVPVNTDADGDPGDDIPCPYGQPGDRLWVRETWCLLDREHWWDSSQSRDWLYSVNTPRRNACAYRSETDTEGERTRQEYGYHWRPSIHMPRWASRLTLEVTGIRVERLHDVSEEDARAEGAYFTDYGRRCFHDWKGPGPCPAPAQHHQQRAGWSMVPTTSHDQCLDSPRMAFANLWNSINGPESWDANPWVWAVEFRRVEGATP